MLLSHAIFDSCLPIEIFTLDTVRLHPETLAMTDNVARRYGVALTVLRPDLGDLADPVARPGELAFYHSPQLRPACCALRQVAPLHMALRESCGWFGGERRPHPLNEPR